MGKVGCLAIPGLELWFNSNDHLPWHFHVRKSGQWEIRVSFLECTKEGLVWELKWAKRGSGPTGPEKRRLLVAVLAHREALLREWDAKVPAAQGGGR